ncbi:MULTISPECIES: hypothetical protein [Pseudomonas]|jgi:hypothetical protein|uniref:Uncharacterized protein n=1 Tax=Pseudomonas syringae pv. japonica str. M301072 TaxID=629262 RepID=F3FBX7_PSESX|nr:MULTISPECIES: hypothetical protein [Pseudomonas]EGH27713.1 hypothetical protein PSYJA_01229 [Pseudomonas syringae pv. japonica str. M301072]KTB99076.1 hypothetical protein AO388_00195 [Pseudomonas sp. ICMP 10191]MDU8417045.1 hypothetical protein [Pseudomonas syringae]RMV81248.1 hypothetical protein ALP04_200062 [Pseudomonas amygdali pv. sesami]
MSNPEHYTHVAKRIAESLDAIGILSDVLAENTVARESSDDGEEQLNCRCEAGVQAAIRLIAIAAYTDLQSIAQGLGIPE